MSLFDERVIAPGVAAWIERMKTLLPEYEELVAKPNEEIREFLKDKLGNKNFP